MSSQLLAELYAAIPDASVTSQSIQLEEMDFSSDEKIHFGHDAVGSGIYPFLIHYILLKQSTITNTHMHAHTHLPYNSVYNCFIE